MDDEPVRVDSGGMTARGHCRSGLTGRRCAHRTRESAWSSERTCAWCLLKNSVASNKPAITMLEGTALCRSHLSEYNRERGGARLTASYSSGEKTVRLRPF